MKIKDIVNRDIVNLTNCEHEPIHVPGSIQPHGFLVAMNAQAKIDFCSGNISDYIGMMPEAVLEKHFAVVFGDTNFEKIEPFLKDHTLNSVLPLKLDFSDKSFQCSLHFSGDRLIFEAEVDQNEPEEIVQVYNQTLQFVSYMNNTNTLKNLCDLVAKGTREITGYDRVMVYRFDKEYNGEVFSESCRDDLEPFLGLHYPHTDIPVQARELYLKNLLRLIADINYTPVPLYTFDDGSQKTLDLSLSILRSTSPIHVEYLKNMGVGATLTISLIHQEKLWGLIACHHYSPKNLTPEIRLAAQLQGQFITSQIDVRQSNEEYEVSRKTNMALEKLTGFDLPPIAESYKIISYNPELLRLCNASGVSMLISGKVYANGIVPNNVSVIALSEWLSSYSHDSSFYTDKIIDFVPNMKQVCDVVSGLIYYSLGNGNSIIWYRPETVIEVQWGGDPEKAIIKDANGLHPRNSFEKWKQVIKNRSKPWMHPEITVAANYAHALQKQINLMLLSEEEIKYRKLSERLRESNEELENINWISTHDLQEPLRKIQFISSMLLSKEEENFNSNVMVSLDRMNKSANRMQNLIVDILKYTRIKKNAELFEKVDLNLLLDEVLADSKENFSESGAEIIRSELPVVNGIPFLLRQLFSNIILNSLKYADSKRLPVIKITADGPINDPNISNQVCHSVSFSDNGIGFEQQYAESIFNIFSRLHNQNEYSGSGVGLALCRKIMQTHDGNITASGKLGEGATFTIYFPCEDV